MMKFRQAFLLYSIFITVFACSIRKATLPFTLETLVGTWENTHKTDSSLHIEKWSKLNDSTLVGVGILIKGGDTAFQEKMKIERIDTNWFYVADVPENDAPVRFEITRMATGEFIAVNMRHDFPKRIHYQVDARNLKAVVSDGGTKKIEYSFVRVD